ncbi:MAG TPA: SpoIIE family protein phosphatase [Chthoniobacteraceae bacterium]|jgi:sigma-B regulation protein RsbU (phosphoserine phosphatase)|nr:SpoIIE family protein phosphatase [Chthoniobacteraceae bacterium]
MMGLVVPAPETATPKRPWYSPKSFRTKFILVVGAAVIFDLLLSGGVALWNVTRLGRDASAEIRGGLERASDEYLANYLGTTALRANSLLGQVDAEVSVLATAMQAQIDRPAPPLAPVELAYDEKGKWAQNREGTSVLSVWGYLLDEQHKPLPEVQREIEQSGAFDAIGASLMAHGAKKLQMYYLGPKERPIMRTTPYSEQAQTFDKIYPGHNDKNFWDFFFPGVYETWEGWIRDPSTHPGQSYVTGTMPYIDAITGNTIITYFHPLWNRERTGCAGAVGVDITLEQMSALITEVHLARTGFGFLTKTGGNVLAISKAGEKTLGLSMKNLSDTPGVTGMDRNFAKSSQPEIAKLRFPTNPGVLKQRVTLIEDGQPQRYLIVQQRLRGVSLWVDGPVTWDYPNLGFVVPERELLATLTAAEAKMDQAVTNIWDGQIGVLVVSLAVVMAAVFAISRRITAGLTALAGAARSMEKNDFSVRVAIPTHDEVGELAHAFNAMSSQIESYTTHLEAKVEERTRKLAAAGEEIRALNEQLKGENLRMGAELDIARRLQMMVLPKPEELTAIPRLDIAAHMEPASEVGGDYYDVLQCGARVKIGIGDVTGHGLESGVLMLMVQAIARTLLENGENDPKRFLDTLNRVLIKNLCRAGSERNLSLSFLDLSEDGLTLTGQHEEVILIRANGELEQIDTIDLGLPIGLEEDITDFIQSHRIDFAAGDTLILYTDGITEAEAADGTLYTMERLCESARRCHRGTAEEIRAAIIRDVKAHTGAHALRDDITLVVIKHLAP